MPILKISLFILSIFFSITAIIVVYFLQPSGKVSDFKDWQPTVTLPSQHQTTLHTQFFGVYTLLFDDGQDQILIDGFFSRPSLWQVLFGKISGNEKYLQEVKKDFGLERTRAILVSHSHYDHALDLPLLAQHLQQAHIVGSKSSLMIAKNNTLLDPSRLHVLPSSQSWNFGDFKVSAFASQHTPPTIVNNDLGQSIADGFQLPAKFSEFKEGGSFDFLIEHLQHRIFVKPSTGFIENQLQDLEVDNLFLGIAQLSRQSKDYQAAYLKETLAVLKPKTVIPIHWDDFFQPLDQPLSFLPRFADDVPQSLKLLIETANQHHIKVVVLTQPTAYPLASQAP